MPAKFKNLKEFGALDRQKRGSKRLIVRAVDDVTNLTSQPDSEEKFQKAESLKKEIESQRSQYEVIQTQLFALCDELEPSEIEEAENSLFDDSAVIQDLVVTAFSRISSILSARKSSQQPKPIAASNDSLEIRDTKLPKIQVPKLLGDIRRYQEFKGLFDSLIHNVPDSQLSKVRKLYYLKEAVKDGEAHKLVKDLPLTDQAYDEAYKSIEKRYNNKRATINAFLHDLFSTEKIANSSGLRKLLDNFNVAMGGIKMCDVKVEDWSIILTFLLCSKLDSKNRNDWDDTIKDNQKYPSLESLVEFLENRAINHETRLLETKPKSDTKKLASFNTNVTTDNVGKPKERGCIVCGKDHLLVQCVEFKAKAPQNRLETIRSNDRCTNCFLKGHTAFKCDKTARCKICSKKHHTLLHLDNPKDEENKNSPHDAHNTNNIVNCCASLSRTPRTLILPTAVVEFECNEKHGLARILLDICSQPTLISAGFVKKFQLATRDLNEISIIKGVGSTEISSTRSCRLMLKSRFSDFTVGIEADVVPASALSYRIANVQLERVFPQISRFNLADIAYDKPTVSIPSIDLIIGVEYYNKLFMNELFQTVENLTLHSSYFGWVISGSTQQDKANIAATFSYSNCISSIDEKIEQFWAIEEPLAVSEPSSEHDACLSHFMNTYIRTEEGRFSLQIPLKVDRKLITDNRSRALQALYKVEKSYDSQIWKEYVAFMREYEEMGHMTLVPANETSLPSYHIPHRAVIRPNALTTQVRVVFNASSSDGKGLSLNEACLNGPVVQPPLFDTLIRFRAYEIVFCADIKKMYRQVFIQEPDRDLQRIFWRESPDKPVLEYRLNTVTYGEKPASFMATECISVLADEVSLIDPKIAELMHTSFYMDDFLAGAKTLEEAITMQRVVHSTLLSAGFELRKYMSNRPELLEAVQNECTNPEPKFINNGKDISVLGIGWKIAEQTEEFVIKITLEDEIKPELLSKKVMLSEISRIFDPLGFVSPVTIKGKIFMQELWRQELKWESIVPEEIAKNFLAYRSSLKQLTQFSIPRFSGCEESDCELIGFCDASASAFCAALYSRWVKNGTTYCTLLCSKTRVAPIKQLTIPKLELEAALLLAKLMNRLQTLFKKNFRRVICFSDAQVVLSWLNRPPENWTPFVSNRVRKITDFIPACNWFFVGTKENPADLATRGITVESFIGAVGKFWLNGPAFMQCDEELGNRCIPFRLVRSGFQVQTLPSPAEKNP